jgi:hypothetical protein
MILGVTRLGNVNDGGVFGRNTDGRGRLNTSTTNQPWFEFPCVKLEQRKKIYHPYDEQNSIV